MRIHDPSLRAGRAVLAGALLAVLLAAPARALEYTIRKVVDSSGEFQHFYPPSINDAGTIVFTAIRDDASVGVFAKSSAGDVVPIADEAGGYGVSEPSTAFASINDAGEIAFHAATATDPFSAIYVSTAFGLPFVAHSVAPGPGEIASLQDPWIGDSGVVVYVASVRPPPDPDGETVLFRGLDRIAGGPAGTTTFQWPDVNALGEVVSVSSDGIYLGSAVVYEDSGSSASLNDQGTIAFFSYAYGPTGIYTGDGVSPPQLYAAATGGTAMGHPDINSSGLVAYMDRAGIADGVYVGSGHEKLTGNFALFGAAVASTDFFRGLNDEGQIAFTYQLATGEKGIALATPRDPAVLGNGEFDNGLALFEVIYGASDGFAFTPGGAGDPRLEMTTTTGVLGVRQPVQTGGGPYRLELEFDWLTAAGSLEVVANDVLVLTVGADASVASPVGTPQVDTLGDFTRVALELTPAALADPADGYVRLDLHPAGSEATIQLDGLSFAPLPEPAGAVLGCGAVAALGVLARQRPRRS